MKECNTKIKAGILKRSGRSLVLAGALLGGCLASPSAFAAALTFFSIPNAPTLNGTGNLSLQATASSTSFPLTFYWYQTNLLVYTWTTNGNLGCTYNLTNAVPTNGGSYHIVISNSVGMGTSAVFTVTINNPYIAAQPNSIVAPQGTTTNFAIAATGTAPMGCSWYRRITGVSTNLAGTGTNLIFSPLTRSDGQYSYFAVVSNQWGMVTSSARGLTVQYPALITNIFSTNVVAEVGQFASLSVSTEGQPTPANYWFKDGVYQPSLAGSSSASIFNVQPTNAGTYILILSNFLGISTSAPIVLTVKPLRGPTITNQPASHLYKIGDSVYLNIGVDGSPTMSYGLYKQGGGLVASGSGYSPSFSASSTNQDGSYYFIISNAYGQATSATVSVTIAQPTGASSGARQFVRIADTLTDIPGLAGRKFNSFRDAFIRGQEVWFGGGIAGVPFSGGVYYWSNSALSMLVDTNTTALGASGRFTNLFGSTWLSDGKVVFGANTVGENGIYAWSNGMAIMVHDTRTIIPGTTNTYDVLGWPSVSGKQIAFLGVKFNGTNPAYRCVNVSSNGNITVLADTNTTLPHLGGKFIGASSQVAFDGTQIAWWAYNGSNYGIFRVDAARNIASMADDATINPATGSLFTGYQSPPDISNGRVYWIGRSGNRSGIFYRDPSGEVITIAKSGDPIPSRNAVFDTIGFSTPASNTRGVYFLGNDGGAYSGIFYWNGAAVTKIIDTLDSLENTSISSLGVEDADDASLLVNVGFVGGRQALYALMPATQSFSQWTAAQQLPVNSNNLADDPDGDGISNIFEYYFGSNPQSAATAAKPYLTRVNMSGQVYPVIQFIRNKYATGVNLTSKVSSLITFTDSLGTVTTSVLDLGDGTEQVTIRSSVPISAQPAQFLRIELTVP